MIINLEGIDACGKTAVSRKLAALLKCKVLHFPDDDAVTGPEIRRHLKGEAKLSPLAFQALQVTNRMEHMSELQKLSCNPRQHVILSRYWQSGWVYGQIDGLDPDWLESIHASMESPDINILLYVPLYVAVQRKNARASGDERYEATAIMEKAAHLYETLWADRLGAQWQVVNANRPLRNVVGECLDIVERLL